MPAPSWPSSPPSSWSICFSAAEKNTSAFAPSAIWVQRVPDESKLNFTVTPVCLRSNCRPICCSASVSDAAANTVSVRLFAPVAAVPDPLADESAPSPPAPPALPHAASAAVATRAAAPPTNWRRVRPPPFSSP